MPGRLITSLTPPSRVGIETPPMVPVLTHKLDDRTYRGVWSSVTDPMIIFADHNRNGRTLSHHGGPIGGAAGGHPVQLVYWGQWWLQQGSSTRSAISILTQHLLASRYFVELGQYGVAPPYWRGPAKTVTQPAPPTSGTMTNTTRAVLGLIDDLIDDDVFPDPDDGPRIAFIVLLPAGYQVTDGTLGAHSHSYDWDNPLNKTSYWAGWARLSDPAGAPPDDTLTTIGHEIAELLTDPEGDGWRTEEARGPNHEIVDAGQSPNAGQAPYTEDAHDQTAYTNDARVQAYWSSTHGRTIIPLIGTYRAQLRAKTQETGRSPLDSGTFRAEPGGLGDCIGDREFWWRIDAVDQRITVNLDTSGYRDPRAADWWINGTRLSQGGAPFWLATQIDGFNGMSSEEQNGSVLIIYTITGSSITINTASSRGNFSLIVGCTVTDASITGRVLSQPTATPVVEIGVTGAELVLDPEYLKRWTECLRDFLTPWLQTHLPVGRPRPGDPLEFDLSVIRQQQRAYTPQREWLLTREIGTAITAAYATLEHDEAQAHTRSLLQGMPSVAGRLAIEDIEAALSRRVD